MDPVTIKLKFAGAGAVIEFAVEAREVFEKTIGQLKREQFSQEERNSVTLVHNGTKLSDEEKLFDLMAPLSVVNDSPLSSPPAQVIVIQVYEQDDMEAV